jgi:hypothetical protein
MSERSRPTTRKKLERRVIDFWSYCVDYWIGIECEPKKKVEIRMPVPMPVTGKVVKVPTVLSHMGQANDRGFVRVATDEDFEGDSARPSILPMIPILFAKEIREKGITLRTDSIGECKGFRRNEAVFHPETLQPLYAETTYEVTVELEGAGTLTGEFRREFDFEWLSCGPEED